MIFSILVVLPILCTMTQSAVLADPVLSGYGGPGQGDQAILGSALLNGSRGGGGTGTSFAGSPGSGASSSINSTDSGGPRTSQSGSGKHAGDVIGHRSGGSFKPYPVSEQGGVALVGADSEMLGFSDADLSYVLLALCILAFTGMLTRRLTRITAAGMHE